MEDFIQHIKAHLNVIFIAATFTSLFIEAIISIAAEKGASKAVTTIRRVARRRARLRKAGNVYEVVYSDQAWEFDGVPVAASIDLVLHCAKDDNHFLHEASLEAGMIAGQKIPDWLHHAADSWVASSQPKLLIYAQKRYDAQFPDFAAMRAKNLIAMEDRA